MHIGLIKCKIKYPRIFNFFKEGSNFLLIFLIVFIAVFTIFNGKAFYQQIKYSLGMNIEKNEDFLKKLLTREIQEELYDVPDSIIIPDINVNAPIVFPETTDEKKLLQELGKGVVFYPDSVLPGQNGNTIILGHSSAYPWDKGKYGSVFSLLGQLKSGGQIIIFYQKHKYVYRVITKEIFKKNAQISVQNENSQLVLISCWPIGTAWKRIVIMAELENR